MTPKQGMAVPEGFRLPHNTSWSMADAWGLSPRQRREATYAAISPAPRHRPKPARVRRRPESAWNADAVLTLRRLWDLGVTCSRIAKKLGKPFTRSSVAAKARRLDLPARKYQAPRGKAA